ncbi:prohibitin family protein [Vicingaceae bacterium]|nr:prohibitin family protein [Vicingaceae bacterium]
MAEFEQPSFDAQKLKPYIIIGAIVIFVFIIFSKAFIILQPTERGVVFKKYTTGLDVDNVLGEGLNIVAPWNDVFTFQIAEKSIEETMDVLSKDGLSIKIDVSLRYRPMPNKIGYLYRSFKDDYVNDLIRPELRSAVREIIGQYTPEELYASKRQEIETKIELNTEAILKENSIEQKTLLFRSITLPQKIKESIEFKLQADQEAQTYIYLIEKEKKEAERRKIDALGKAEANKILSASITENILKEKGISATEELAKSPNSKIIVIGGGKDGLPIILNGQ